MTYQSQVCKTESDVEQKILFPFITTDQPHGLGYSAADVATKLNIRGLDIKKGQSRKRYFPDYLALLNGLPVLVVEAKTPGENVIEALAEARLYAHAVNALYSTGVNPCQLVVASDGIKAAFGRWDTESLNEVDVANWQMTDPRFAEVIAQFSRKSTEQFVKELCRKIHPKEFYRAASLVGGESSQNEEIQANTFGQDLALRHASLFNPRSPEDRALVAKRAYIPSRRRQRYVEPIDRTIRNAIPPGVSHIPAIEDSSAPREVIGRLGKGEKLEHQIMLLVGSVGSGKSTFVDYLYHEALPATTRASIVWSRIDLNDAPLDKSSVYRWITRELIESLRASQPDVDFDDIDILQKVYAVEIEKLKKGPLKLLRADSEGYKTRLADGITTLLSDETLTARALARYLCAERRKLLVVALDNCDKRIRDEQLLMFNVAQWVQREFRCLVILPLRDVTYDMHRGEPPLDTALKDLVFRIEPPVFSQVLSRRIELALEIDLAGSRVRSHSYVLPGGAKVEYSATDRGLYLACILKSLFVHDLFVRRVISGIAGRDVRKAMEIFLEFCQSGHIGEDEIFKIRSHEGEYALPLSTVTNVLLRRDRRFYDGNHAHLKNLFQCSPHDPSPNHLVRLAILRWLEKMYDIAGPAGAQGYHRTTTMLSAMAACGLDVDRSRKEALYLLEAGAIIAEHLRKNVLDDDDLIALSPSGFIHLSLITSTPYVAACAEDVWCSDMVTTNRIADRIGKFGIDAHYSEVTQLRNATDLVTYLKSRHSLALNSSGGFLLNSDAESLLSLDSIEDAVTSDRKHSRSTAFARVYLGNLPYTVTEREIVELFHSMSLATPTRVVLPRVPDTNALKGHAFVDLPSMPAVEAAIGALDGVIFQNRQLKANEAVDYRR